jgi:hypothetical protein
MAGKKISELTELEYPLEDDMVPIVDDDVVTTKKITYHNLMSGAIESLSSSILTGGIISDGTDVGTIDITSQTTLLRIDTSETSSLRIVSVEAQSGITIPLENTLYYVVLEYNDGSPTISLETDYPNNTTNLCIGKCMKDDCNVIHICNCGMRLINGVSKLHRRGLLIEYNRLAQGCSISDAGSRNFNMTSGYIYEGINLYTPEAFSSLTDKFSYIYNNGSWVCVENQTTIDNTQYNNYGVGLATLGPNKFGCHWVYIHPDDGHVYVVYGTGNYSKADALNAGPPANLPPVISEFACLIGCIIIKKNNTSFSYIQMVTDKVFTGTGATNHNNLSNLQGGEVDEYYHMTSAQHTEATQNASTSQKGLCQFDSDNFNVVDGVVSIKQNMKRTPTDGVDYNPSALTTDYIIAVDAGSEVAVTISTEDIESGSTSNPRVMIVKDETGGANENNITVSLENGGTIDGAASHVMDQSYQSVTLYLDGRDGYTI